MTATLAHRDDLQTTTPRGALAAVLLALTTVISAVASLMVAIPSLARSTGATPTELAWVVDAYALVFATFLLPGGSLGDRFGRRRLLVGGLALFLAGSLAPVFLDSPWQLIGVRGVMGLAAAMIMPATLSTITSTFPEDRRASAVALWAGFAGAGAVIGLFVAGVLLRWYSWRSVFLASAVLALVSLVATIRSVPESAEPEDAAKDPAGAVISAAGLWLLVYSIIEAPTYGWSATRTWLGMTGGLVVLAVFLLWERRAVRPLLAPRYFAVPEFGAGALSLTAQFLAYFGFILVFVQYVQLVRGYSPLLTVCAALPLPLGLLPAAQLSTRLLPRLGQATQVAAGLLVVSAALWWLSRSDAATPYWQIACGLWPLGVGMGLAMPPATAGITCALPAAEQGVASAMNDLTREVGGAIGIAVLSSVLTSRYTSHLDLATVPVPLARTIARSPLSALFLPDPVASMARSAYAAGLHAALLTGAAVTAVAAVTVLGLLARRRRQAPAAE